MTTASKLVARLRAIAPTSHRHRHVSLPVAAIAVGVFAFAALDTARHGVAAAPASVAVLLPMPAIVGLSPRALAEIAPPAEPGPDAVASAPDRDASETAATEADDTAVLAGLAETAEDETPPPPIPVLVERSEELAWVFARHNYTLASVMAGDGEVPALAVLRMPSDLGKIAEVSKRKRLFIKAMLAMMLQVNQEIAADRQRIVALRVQLESGEGLTETDQTWLEEGAASYGVQPEDYGELLRRVDMIPPSLAIAQSVTESGWGTSYPARAGNALFGQYHFSSSDKSTVVGQHVPGTFQLRAFETVVDSVAAYARNLNTHNAYRKFRAQRAEMRGRNAVLDGYTLAGTLLAYSERGQDYIDFLRLIMRTEKLRTLDEAKLQRS